MGMMMAVSFERYGRLYYLDPGSLTPRVGDKVLVPTDGGPEVADVIWAPQWVDDDVDGLPVCAGLATDDHLSRDEANRGRRAEARGARPPAGPRARPAHEDHRGGLRQRPQRVHDLLQRARPGRLPRSGPRPGRQTARPGGTAPDRPAGRGAAAGRHRAVRPRPVLLHVPEGL